MAKSNDPNVIQVGLSADVEGFVKEIKKELASVKGLGLSDAIKDEIKSIEGMLDGLAKSFSDGMDMKLDTKTFAAFEVKVSKDMQAIDERVTNLEDSMQALVTTMDSADSGKLSSALQDIGNKMQLLNGFTDETVKTMRELINIASKSNGLVQFADNTTLSNLKKESALLERIKKVSGDLSETKDYDRSAEWGKNKKLSTALEELSEAYKKVSVAKENYEKAIQDNVDNFTLAQVKKEYAETFAYLNSLRDEADQIFGQDIANTHIPNKIHKILQDSREEIESFYEWSVNRLSSVEEARNRINKKAAISVDKSENGKASIKIPMQVSTTGRGLAEQARRVLNIAQDNLKESLKVDFVLQSKYSSRKTNELLKEWQQQIEEIDSPELREKFQGFYDSIAKGFQKEIKVNVTSDIDKEEIKVKKTIEQIKKLVGKKIHIFPEFDIKDVDVAKLQKKVDRVAKQLKLNVELLPKDSKKESNAQLEALNAISELLKNKLEILNKTYLYNIKKSLADILSLAQTLKDSVVKTDAPIDELVQSVKDLTVAFHRAFGLFSKEDIDGIFERMQKSVKGIRGSLEGGKENLLVAQLHEILDLYREYQRMGGTQELSDLGGTKKVQKWLADNYTSDFSKRSQFKTEGKFASEGYAEGIREGIPDVEAAATEMAEAALEAVRKTQDSNSPSKRFKKLGKDGAKGYGQGWLESADEIKKSVSEAIDAGVNVGEESVTDVNQILEKNLEELKQINNKRQEEVSKIQEEQKSLDDMMQKMLSSNQEKIGDNTIDFSAKSKKALTSIKENIEDVGNGTIRLLDEIGISYEELIRKIEKENKKGQFQERIAFIKDGKVVESLKGQYGEVSLPEVSRLPKSDKVVHTHPYTNSLGGVFSPEDYLEWYQMMLEGVSSQFELYWKKQNVSIDFSGVKKELVDYVSNCLMNIAHVAGAQFEDVGKSIPLQVSEAYNLLSNQLLEQVMKDYDGSFSSNIRINKRETKRYNLSNLYNALEQITYAQRSQEMFEGDWSWDRYLAGQKAKIKSGDLFEPLNKALQTSNDIAIQAKYAADEYEVILRYFHAAMRDPGVVGDYDEILATLKELNEKAKPALEESEYLKRKEYLDKKTPIDSSATEETKQSVQELNASIEKVDKTAKIALEDVQRVAYHYGDLFNGQPSHQFGGEFTAWLNGIRNGGRGWGDGTGTYTTSDITQFEKGDFSDALKKFYAIDTSTLKLYEQHVEEDAEHYFNFAHHLEQLCIKMGSGFEGFDENLKGVNPTSLYRDFQQLFADSSLTFEEFNSFLQEMASLVKKSGLAADGTQNAMKLASFKKSHGIDDIKTRFMKMLGYQGTDFSGTSFDSLQDGSVIFSDVEKKIVKSANNISDVFVEVNNQEQKAIEQVIDITDKQAEANEKLEDINNQIVESKKQQKKITEENVEIEKDSNKFATDEEKIAKKHVASAKEITAALKAYQKAFDEQEPFARKIVAGFEGYEDVPIVQLSNKIKKQLKEGAITEDEVVNLYQERYQKAFQKLNSIFPNVDVDELHPLFNMGTIFAAFDSLEEAGNELHEALKKDLDIESIIKSKESKRNIEALLDELDFTKRNISKGIIPSDQEMQDMLLESRKTSVFGLLPEDAEKYVAQAKEVFDLMNQAYARANGKPYVLSEAQDEILSKLASEKLTLEDIIKLWKELGIQAEKVTLLNGNQRASATGIGDLNGVDLNQLNDFAIADVFDTILHSHADGLGTFSPEDIQLIVDNWEVGIRKLLLLVDGRLESLDFSSVSKETAEKIASDYLREFIKAIDNHPLGEAVLDNNAEFAKLKKNILTSILQANGLELKNVMDSITQPKAEIEKNADNVSKSIKEIADNGDKTDAILKNMYDNLGKIVLQIDKDAKEAADSIALIIKSAEKLEKVDSPFAGTKAWSSLNRRRKNDKAEDSIAAKNIQVFTSAYQKTGQKAILDVINNYASKSNLNDDLKKRVQTLLSSAIKSIDEGIKAALKEAPQTETKTMTHKQFKEYLKKYAIWGQDEETFNYNFKVQKETMQKDGRAFRPINKNGKLGAWLYNVEVPINQLSTGLEKVQENAEKTNKTLGQTVITGRKKLDKVIEQYQKLYAEQQNLYRLRSPLTSENGDTIIRPDYEELGNRLAEVTDKMQSLTDRGFNNFKVNLHQLALGLQEVEQKTDTVKEKIETPSKAPLKTEVNAVKNLRDELTKIVSTETGYNSEDIANLLGMDLDDVNKRLLDYAFGGASTKQIVDGFMSVYEALHKDEEQAEKTDKAIAEVGKTPSKGLQKHIDKYQELEKRQQEYLSKMSEMATTGVGKISNPEEYARLKHEQDLTFRQMQKEAERIRNLSKAHVEVAEAAEKQSNAEKQAVNNGVTPSLQEKIDKYKELKQRQQDLFTQMSPKVDSKTGNLSIPENYSALKKEAMGLETQMQRLVDRVFKNYNKNLLSLINLHGEAANAVNKETQAEEKQSAETNTISKSLQKKIDKYTELKKKQQELFSQMSPKVNSKTGQLTIPDNYYDLKKEAMGLDTQMQRLVEKTYKNHNTSLLQLVDFQEKVTASTNDYNKAEEKQISQSASVSASLQKKIDKYRELKKQQQELLESMSKMAMTDSGHIENPKAYASLKNKEDSISRQINNLLEKAYKNNKANLNTYVGNDLEVSSSSAQVANDVQKAVDAIEAEGQAAQKGTKKKEKLTKAEKKLAKGSKEAADETDKAAKAIEDEYKKAEKAREKVLKEEQKYRRAIAKIPYDETAGMLKEMDTAKFNQNFTGAFQSRIDELRDKLEKLFSSETIDLDQLEKAKAEFKDINNILSNTRNAAGILLADETSVSGLKANIASFYDQNTAMSSKFKKQIKDLLNLLEDGGNITRTELKSIKTEFNNISAEVKRLHQTGQSFGSSFLKQLKSANAQLIATYFSFQDFIRYAREGFQTIVEVDTALTELRKVSDASDDRLAQSFKASTETAKELGSTISDVIGVTADWARLGYSVDEAEKLARITTLFQTVGDNMSAEETSSYMVSTLQGFQMTTDQAMEIADKFNEVANNFAIDTKGIGESLQRSAASFNAANTSLSESIALVTATNTVVQDPSSVGTLWKTLSARIRGAKTELQELDEEEDEFTETTSKLQGLVKSLTGFDILEQDGKTFKSIYDIIIGIGKEWKNLTDIEQASLGEALAGKRNANALYAVLNNIETLENAYATAEDAQGSAMREQENYAKSIQYSIDVLKASAQEFWTTLINSGAAKKVIDFLTLLLNTLTKITEVTNGIPIFAGAGLLAAFGKDPQGAVTKLSNTFERFFGFFKTGTTSITETINVLDGGASGLEAIQAGAEVAADGMATLGTKTVATQSAFATLMANPITPWIVGIGLALGVAAIAWDTFTTTVKEAQKDVDKTAGKISSLQSEIKELQDMDYRTSDQEKRLDYLEQELKYQEQIFEIEKKRLLQEKIGNKFSDSFDRENYNTKFKLESNAQRGDTAAGLLASIKARNETLESNKELQQQYIDYLDKNRSNMSPDEIAEYTREIASLGETILDINDKNIVSVDSLHDKVQEFQAIIDDAQEGIDSGLLIGSDKADAEKIIENYTGLIKEINDVITPVLKESGLFDYSSAIESTFEKVEFDGIKEKLLEIAKSEDLSPELLTEKYSELIANLKLAGVDADALYKYLMKLSGLVDRSNLTDKINGQIRHGYGVGTLSGSEYDRHRLSNYINSLSEEDAQLVAGLDVDWSTFDADEVIEKMKSEIAKSHENPVTVDVEPTIVDSVEGINKRLKPQFDELGELYKSIFYGDNGFSLEHITNDQLQGIKSAFLDAEDERGEKIGVRYEGATEAVNEFIDTLTSAETKSKSLAEQQKLTQDAVNKLATTYFYAAGGLRELNDETKDAIRQQFKEMGIVNIDEVIEGADKTQEWIDSLLDFDQALESEYDKVYDWGLEKYAEQIEDKTIQTKFGNVDMDKRAVITWSNEMKKTYEKELESWEYDPEVGSIDTVRGGTASFFAGNKEVQVAYTPIIEVDDHAEMLGKQTVENYIQSLLDEASKDGEWSLDEVLRLDREGWATQYSEDGQVIGRQLGLGIIAGIDDLQDISAIDIGELMHFSGMSGAIQLAEKDIADLEAIEAELAAQGKTVADITQDDINAWLLAGQVSEQAAMQLQMYVYAKALSNGTFMNETASVQSLMQLCRVANLGVELISELNELEGLSSQASTAYANKQYEYGDALMAEYRTRLSQAQSKIQAAWNEKFQLPEIDFSQANTDAGKAGGDAADAYVEAYEKEKKELENQRDMGIISEKEYLDKLKALIDKFFKDRAEYAEKYMDEMKSYMDSLLSYYNSVISGVTTLLDHRINKIQEQKETTIDALEEEKTATEERYQAEIDAIDETIKAKQEIIDGLQEEIDAIDKANEARDRSINLQKAEYDLQRQLHQRTKLVYTGTPGQMRYERDEQGVRDAREAVNDAQDDIAKAKIQERIDLIQKEIDLLEKQKESIQEQMEETSKYYEKLIKEQEKMFDSMVKELEETKSKWEELAEVDEISKAWGLVSEEMESLGYSIEDVLNGNDAAFNAFKDRYIAVLSEMHSGDEHYLQGLQETAGKIPEKLGEVGTAAFEAAEPVKGLSDSASTASTNVGTLGTKASTAATGVSQLKSSSEGVADNLKGLNDVEMGGLINGPLTELENKLTTIRNLINGEGGASLKSALDELSEGLSLQTVVDAFTQLANAVKTVVVEIGGGGADQEETYGGAGRSGKNGMPREVPASAVSGGTGEGLVGAINAVGEAAQASVGSGVEDTGATAIGSFNALNTAVQGVVDLIGQAGDKESDEEMAGTLSGAITSLLETTKTSLIAGGEDGVIGMFSELAEQIGACAEAAASLLSAIQAMQGMGFPVMPISNGQYTGTAIPHAEGTAKYDGDWGIKHNEKALTGELGPEILLRDGKYHILGKNGPEFVNLKKDDVILNHKQSAQVLSKKNKVGPSHADGTLPNGFFRLAEDSSLNVLRAKIKESGLPTLDGIKNALQAQTNAIKSEVRNIVNNASSTTTVNQSNTFNIRGVSGEDVARQINTTLVNTFSGMSLNAYQRSMA